MLHEIANYVVGSIVVSLPFFLGLADSSLFVLVVPGIIVIFYSLLTNNELDAVRFLRVRLHLLLHALLGAAMLISPWLVDFPGTTRWPVYVIGVLAVILAVTTQTRAGGTAATN
jgi:hypothetical protein